MNPTELSDLMYDSGEAVSFLQATALVGAKKGVHSHHDSSNKMVSQPRPQRHPSLACLSSIARTTKLWMKERKKQNRKKGRKEN
jgi:hypothetical protein